MTEPHSRNTPEYHRGNVTVRIAAGAGSVATGGLWLFCALRVLTSRFATDPAVDPHGYALIFGTVLALPAGLACALALPFAFPQHIRPRVVKIVMPSFTVASLLLFVALLTA